MVTTRTKTSALLAALVLLTAAGLWWIFSGDGEKRITAYFDRAVGVYPGSDVQVLGVRVGAVQAVTPRGETVEVVLTLDPDVGVAEDTDAVVIAPSVVADRYVQFTKLSRGGPELPDGARIPIERTATPVELDELYASLNDLLTALGPDGANSTGALSDLLDTGAANLAGNGAAFNENVRNFAQLARTLSGSSQDLFGTVDELQKFTTMLAGNDHQVAQVNQQLAQVWRTLSADRDELSGALRSLGSALAEVQDFIRDNRALIKSNVDKLAKTTQLLVDHRASLAEAIDVVPLAAANVVNAFDPESGTLQGRIDLPYFLPYPQAAPPPGMVAAPAGQPEDGPPLPLPAASPVFQPAGQGGAR